MPKKSMGGLEKFSDQHQQMRAGRKLLSDPKKRRLLEEKMSKDPAQQSYLLDAAICSSDMFSMSNPTSESDGDFEFNKVELDLKNQSKNIPYLFPY